MGAGEERKEDEGERRGVMKRQGNRVEGIPNNMTEEHPRGMQKRVKERRRTSMQKQNERVYA